MSDFIDIILYGILFGIFISINIGLGTYYTMRYFFSNKNIKTCRQVSALLFALILIVLYVFQRIPPVYDFKYFVGISLMFLFFYLFSYMVNGGLFIRLFKEKRG